MKKVALSLFVIAASGAYVWSQAARPPADDLLGAEPVGGGILTGSIPRQVPASGGAAPQAIPELAPFNPPDVGAAPELRPASGNASPGKPADDLTPAPPLPPAPARSASIEAPPPPVATLFQTPAAVPVPRPRPAYREPPASQLVTRAAMTVAPVAAAASYVDGTYTGPVVDAYYGPIQIQATIQGGRLSSVRVLQYPADRRTSVAINRQALPMLRDEVVSAQSARVDIISGATLTSEAFIRSLDGALKQARS